ncbi:MAG: hypothetical protein WC676_00735 [Candidatus Omnitrophota bacterium]
MKKIIVVLLLSLFAATVVSAKGKTIQFSLVLTQEEAQKTAHKKYLFANKPGKKAEEILVNKDAFLTNADISAFKITKKEDARNKILPVLNILFTDQGSQKLAEITTANTKRQIAIIVDNEVYETVFILFPLVKGYTQITSWKIDTNEKAASLVKDLGFDPAFRAKPEK